MIRVLVAGSTSLESSVRSIGSLEFAGTTDPYHPQTELDGDVLLIEVRDPNGYDWAALGDLPIPVILLLDSADSALIISALRAGLRGAISWDATPQEMESAVHAVYAGLGVIAPALIPGLLPETSILAEELADPLSSRELEVLDLLAEGLSNKLIAYHLNISEHTVKTHVASIFAKLGASSRTEAVSQAIRKGLVML